MTSDDTIINEDTEGIHTGYDPSPDAWRVFLVACLVVSGCILGVVLAVALMIWG